MYVQLINVQSLQRADFVRLQTQPTSTRSSSKCTPTLVFPTRLVFLFTALLSSLLTRRPGYAYPQLVCQRHLRAHCDRGIQARSVQQKIDGMSSLASYNCGFQLSVLAAIDILPRDPDRCSIDPARRAQQARHLRRHQGCHQILCRWLVDLCSVVDAD
jgi:hypothetical protein